MILFYVIVCHSNVIVHRIHTPQREKFYVSDYDSAQDFIRGNLRALFTDTAVMPYSWFGQRGNIAIARFHLVGSLIGECVKLQTV